MSDQAQVRFTFNGKALVDRAIATGQVASLHQAAQRAGISYPTAFQWNKAQGINSPAKISLEALAKFLLNGLGYKWEQIGEMKVSDLFSLVGEAGETDPQVSDGTPG